MLSLMYKIWETKIPENTKITIFKPNKEKQIIIIKGQIGQNKLSWTNKKGTILNKIEEQSQIKKKEKEERLNEDQSQKTNEMAKEETEAETAPETKNKEKKTKGSIVWTREGVSEGEMIEIREEQGEKTKEKRGQLENEKRFIYNKKMKKIEEMTEWKYTKEKEEKNEERKESVECVAENKKNIWKKWKEDKNQKENEITKSIKNEKIEKNETQKTKEKLTMMYIKPWKKEKQEGDASAKNKEKGGREKEDKSQTEETIKANENQFEIEKASINKQIKNIILGINQGYSINLELKGIGYTATEGEYKENKKEENGEKGEAKETEEKQIGQIEANKKNIEKRTNERVKDKEWKGEAKKKTEWKATQEEKNKQEKKIENKLWKWIKKTKKSSEKGAKEEKTQEKKNLILRLGTSHNIIYPTYEHEVSIKIIQGDPIKLALLSISQQVIKQVAAEIYLIKKPEPYKGKGIQYEGKKIVIKEKTKQKKK